MEQRIFFAKDKPDGSIDDFDGSDKIEIRLLEQP